LPSLTGVRLGRTVTTVATLVGVFYLTEYFERRNHLSTALFVPRLIQAVPTSYTNEPTTAERFAC